MCCIILERRSKPSPSQKSKVQFEAKGWLGEALHRGSIQQEIPVRLVVDHGRETFSLLFRWDSFYEFRIGISSSRTLHHPPLICAKIGRLEGNHEPSNAKVRCSLRPAMPFVRPNHHEVVRFTPSRLSRYHRRNRETLIGASPSQLWPRRNDCVHPDTCGR